ncbi:helix-turn-helix domain-containing protein [Streptomyces murinus]
MPIRTPGGGLRPPYGFVHRVLAEAGTAMRSRGGPNDRHRTAC